jgi:CO/xanthine dehydrogenase FAD-binding subunit
VADLQDLHLDRISQAGEWIEYGSCVRLQTLVEATQSVPEAMRVAASQEAGWNLRNAATLGGMIAGGGSRSPLLVTLVALLTQVRLEPDGDWSDLDRVLASRPGSLEGKLITSLRLRVPSQSAYEQVGRTPADWPTVAAAAAAWGGTVAVALGGFGERPVRLTPSDGAAGFAASAAQAFAGAGDEWASAAYRSAVGAILARRVVERLTAR